MPINHPSLLSSLAIALCLLIPSVANAACPSEPTAERFAVNGAEVTDHKTGLTWARCSLGQVWAADTCSGTAATYAHEQALAAAQAETGWRLPHVKELNSLVDDGCRNPAIDTAPFPAAPGGNFWSSTPQRTFANSASLNAVWAVNFDTGEVSALSREANRFPIRLVRIDPP